MVIEEKASVTEFWQHFFTTQQTQVPTISSFWYAMILLGLVVLAWLTALYHDRAAYVRFFKGLQLVQLVALYGWYLLCRIPLDYSLPLYHCRIAMFGLVFLPDRWRFKQYIGLMGFSGAIFALGYPVMDPYSFPHITGISFLLGHFVLFTNGLIYLLNYFKKDNLSLTKIVVYTFVLDLFLLGVNQLTGGNYGILREPPFIDPSNVWFNYLVVSSVLSLALILTELGFRRFKRTQ